MMHIVIPSEVGESLDVKLRSVRHSSIQNLKSGNLKIEMSIYRRVLRYYRPFLGQTILGLFLSLLGVGLNLLKPWPFKLIVDDFLRPGPSAQTDWHVLIPLLCLALILIQVFWGMMNWI